MTTETSWKVSDEAKRLWAETNERIRKGRQAYVERAIKLGDELDATLVGVWIPRPGLSGDPAVFRSNQDGSYFRVAGKRGEVAMDDDSEVVKNRAKLLFSVPLDFIGDYAIVRFDLNSRIEDGILFYTPRGYPENKRYNPETDQPISSD
ncbi:MAG: hypothetical protein A3A65_04210 [Candidatus Chisholmbacteria bacterium RIFCSPLOWO2_01_FULL_49_14]|uniref:Uncharacterized protein n=1 Tax=Candidatus Chisholmbacteria bacterium RIFCSPLOWO2_01_FULL_49_14 TaxID=1797593 RepID=A0A1G1VVT4_9BACT|nr:MAG: hypothetical protein A3A65_04210 [Candidatus Chisholmbacteria bacterium RIFCSPLOWO2_01_FULL_49_14]